MAIAFIAASNGEEGEADEGGRFVPAVIIHNWISDLPKLFLLLANLIGICCSEFQCKTWLPNSRSLC